MSASYSLLSAIIDPLLHTAILFRQTCLRLDSARSDKAGMYAEEIRNEVYLVRLWTRLKP